MVPSLCLPFEDSGAFPGSFAFSWVGFATVTEGPKPRIAEATFDTTALSFPVNEHVAGVGGNISNIRTMNHERLRQLYSRRFKTHRHPNE